MYGIMVGKILFQNVLLLHIIIAKGTKEYLCKSYNVYNCIAQIFKNVSAGASPENAENIWLAIKWQKLMVDFAFSLTEFEYVINKNIYMLQKNVQFCNNKIKLTSLNSCSYLTAKYVLYFQLELSVYFAILPKN